MTSCLGRGNRKIPSSPDVTCKDRTDTGAFWSTASTSSSLRSCAIIHSKLFSGKQLFDRREFWRAVHSSALVDGLFCVGRLQQPNDIGSVAAHIAIGFTGQRHRHSGVVRLTGHRQDSVLPVVLGLHQFSPACAELLAQKTIAFGVIVCKIFARRGVMRARREACGF